MTHQPIGMTWHADGHPILRTLAKIPGPVTRIADVVRLEAERAEACRILNAGRLTGEARKRDERLARQIDAETELRFGYW